MLELLNAMNNNWDSHKSIDFEIIAVKCERGYSLTLMFGCFSSFSRQRRVRTNILEANY